MSRTGARAGALAFAILLAGCVGGGQSESTIDPAADAGTKDAGGNATSATNLSFGMPATDVTVWANGSVGPAASCASTCGTNITDISAVVPHGGPVLVWAELRHDEPAPVGSFTIELFIEEGDDAFTYGSRYIVHGSNRVVAWSSFSRGMDAVTVEAFSYKTGTTEPAAYSLEIRIIADPLAVPALAPAAFEAEPGSTYELRPDGTGPVEAVVYGPGDLSVAVFNGSQAFRFTPEVAGQHVVLSEYASANLTLVNLNGTGDAALLPLGLEGIGGELQPFVGAGPMTWTFQADTAPTEVSVAVVSPMPVQAAPTQDHVIVESPVGTVLDAYAGCADPCVVAGFSAPFVSSAPGDANLVSGTYTVTVTPGVAETGYVSYFHERLVRTR